MNVVVLFGGEGVGGGGEGEEGITPVSQSSCQLAAQKASSHYQYGPHTTSKLVQ